ncbi:cyclase family protein [Corynebacterium guangdongense]|uniref:Kynurenine formamidase n=1 Tax=Corynebacterium guangdongense TaxID=1783348 RepID=A0ABU2A1F6_9CORY|nr:cyclase family protein [Corynebacterium guangdongense]MDR7330845.1 kynurenine formamidase [Corynebacterium guangdongense]WJZ16860.1 Kynurenine formamidase [Corynebacterium guangdongense]
MSILAQLADALATGSIEVIDLTQPLEGTTPILELPEEFGQTAQFRLEEISRYDDRGPAWYWNNFRTGEHTGTHIDAPVHWISGRDGLDVSEIPVNRLVGPAVVLDFSAEVAADPDFLLTVDHVQGWIAEHGEIPAGAWLIYRTGWSAFTREQASALNKDENGSHTPGMSAECAKWLAAETDVLGLGVETVGTDAGQGHSQDPMYPCHFHFLGNSKLGLAQLTNVDRLPVTGAIIVAGPLKIAGGSGSPARVFALVER